MFDLHLHTNMSDGADSPIELLEKVEEMGFTVFPSPATTILRANKIILRMPKKRSKHTPK